MLRVEGVDAYYGLSHVLQGVSLTVEAGEAVALLGRNGAGKTTTLKTIMAVVRARRGRITWNGADITGLPPYRIVQLGIGYVPEERRIFPNLSVYENLKMARLHVDGGRRMDGYVARVLELFPPLAERLSNKGRTLSGGEQQMLTMARSLGTDPKLLLIDEPTEGLMPAFVETISRTILEIQRQGVAVLLVEQNTRLALEATQRVYLIEKGVIKHEARSPIWRATPRRATATWGCESCGRLCAGPLRARLPSTVLTGSKPDTQSRLVGRREPGGSVARPLIAPSGHATVTRISRPRLIVYPRPRVSCIVVCVPLAFRTSTPTSCSCVLTRP